MPIDWSAVRARARSARERNLIEALRNIDRLRSGGGSLAPAQPVGRTWGLRVLLTVAVLQLSTAFAVAVMAAASGQTLSRIAPQLVLAASFAVASLLLAGATSRDPRLIFLLSTLAFAGSAFARAVVVGLAPYGDASASLLFHGVFPEAFAHASLWQFAVRFPEVRRFTPFDMIARRAAGAAWIVAAFLFILNLLLAYGRIDGPLAALGRDNRGNLFWHLFVLSALPAAVTILVRAFRAPHREQKKVVRFACAIAAGSGPFLVAGIVRMLNPAVDVWMRNRRGLVQAWTSGAIMAALAAMPILISAAVVLDRPPGVRFRALGRPVAWLRRAQRTRLTRALDRVRLARGSREIAAVLRRELQFALRASAVHVEHPDALPERSALVPMLAASPGAIDLSRHAEPFVLLPTHDREWLEGRGITAAAALRLRDGTMPAIVLLAFHGRGAGMSGADHWFLSTLLTGAAGAWDQREPPAAHFGDDEQAGYECTRCGAVTEAESDRCCASPEAGTAALPRTLSGKFLVERRLGAGGMGVAYLAQDLVLGRDVALKTLPLVRDGRIALLRDEARAMAALNHESLATIYGIELWRRTPVLVVEYFPGGTLADRLRDERLALADLLRIGIRLAAALSHMHRRGILHRDLKPSNIGFTSDGLPKLFDFGLAAATVTAGTPDYMPPEALRGEAPAVATDLWALATVLLRASSDSDARGPMASFFARALAPAPQDRFQSAGDMRAALARVLKSPRRRAR